MNVAKTFVSLLVIVKIQVKLVLLNAAILIKMSLSNPSLTQKRQDVNMVSGNGLFKMDGLPLING